MAKKHQCWQFLARFLPFLGKSYVKIGQELASEMQILSR